jgi:hypothetical protein
MKDVLYYDVNGTKCYPRTLRDAFPSHNDANPFGKPAQWEIDFDNVVSYIVIFIVGFLIGLIYAHR